MFLEFRNLLTEFRDQGFGMFALVNILNDTVGLYRECVFSLKPLNLLADLFFIVHVGLKLQRKARDRSTGLHVQVQGDPVLSNQTLRLLRSGKTGLPISKTLF